MRLCALFSGGKDSTYALYLASKYHEISCLLTMIPENEESWMFHWQNSNLTKIQSEAMEIPIIVEKTSGKKELEVEDLLRAVLKAKEKYGIQGVVTGAIRSTYQATRVQKVCKKADLWCFNPLWLSDEIELLKSFIADGFKAIVVAVSSFPFTEDWLGRKIDKDFVKEISKLKNKYGISAVGEGGEMETFVYDGPIFKKKIEIKKTEKIYKNYSGILKIVDVELVEK